MPTAEFHARRDAIADAANRTVLGLLDGPRREAFYGRRERIGHAASGLLRAAPAVLDRSFDLSTHSSDRSFQHVRGKRCGKEPKCQRK